MEKVLNSNEKLEKVKKFINNELNNENIISSYVEDNLLILKINQSKNYMLLSEPLEEFYSCDDIEGVSIYEINGTDFTIVGYEHFNTTIYNITLELYNCYR